ncbi:uncharacterized protein LOC124206059 isoform X2 [Daphnia pulex]|uniref:uncharacterized protein LOC124206059 isoform X2 n=1 Tax=Daphnia pulex TaxID=6669 RepID=UPI001EDD2989|nr:uncharacterized protein LOC124206059 isoform X2 [Daphnia pulex]
MGKGNLKFDGSAPNMLCDKQLSRLLLMPNVMPYHTEAKLSPSSSVQQLMEKTRVIGVKVTAAGRICELLIGCANPAFTWSLRQSGIFPELH